MGDVSENRPPLGSGGNAFPPTAWTLVQQAGGGDAASRDPALNELAQRYWRPIYVYLRYSGRSSADAEDLTQGFFIHLLEKELLARVDVALRRG